MFASKTHCRTDWRRPRKNHESPAAKRSFELETAVYKGPPPRPIAQSAAISPRQYTSVSGNIILWYLMSSKSSKPFDGCVRRMATTPRTTLKLASILRTESAVYGKISTLRPSEPTAMAVFDRSTSTGTRQLARSDVKHRSALTKRLGWLVDDFSALDVKGNVESTAASASNNSPRRLEGAGSEVARRRGMSGRSLSWRTAGKR
mmetsp:Transcript_62983/g.136739  ORF Transcript_62983/g.136739 Transcript_62983/m.136739 type:complete len:204 (-) Transcript_62983:164-775(-)